ncbi:MAG: hypothetical protein AB8I08_29280 [Sandaracinaceae bacterium]
MSQQHPREYVDLALAVYVEDIVRGKDVLYVGRPDGAAASRLGKAARRVDLVAPDAHARGTRRGGRVRTRRWPTEEDAGAWDVVIIADLVEAGLASDERVEEAASWLAPRGVLIASAEDPSAPGAAADALTYEGVFDLLEGAFDAVRMVGQAPFAGWSVVDFAPPGEMEVTFDGSLLEGSGEAAQRYVALCGERDVVLDPYAIIQIPAGADAAPAASVASDSSSELRERLHEQQDVLDAANLHAEELEKELDGLGSRLKAADEKLTSAKRAADAAGKSRDAATAAASKLEKELASLRAAQKKSPRQGQTNDEEFVRLETALFEAGRELTLARAEVQRRGVLVRDVVEELREARTAVAEGVLFAAPSGPTASGEVTPAELPAPAAALTIPVAAPPGFVSEDTLELPASELHGALQNQVAEAVERAVAAEAEKAALQFRLDEVEGALAVAEGGAVAELEALRRVEAALRGTVRGLNARLAEVTELYQTNEARLALLEDDSRISRDRTTELQRELAETRERLELEMARAAVVRDANDAARSPTLAPPPVSAVSASAASAPPENEAELARLRAVEAHAAEREGKLLGALMKCRDDATDVALQVREARREADSARAMLEQSISGQKLGYENRIAEVVAELDQASSQAERALIRVGELESRLQSRTHLEASLRGELSGVSLRLADREAAVRELTAAKSAPPASAEPAAVQDSAVQDSAAAHADAAGSIEAALTARAETHGESDEFPPEDGPRVVVAGREGPAEPDDEALQSAREEAEALRGETEALREEVAALREAAARFDDSPEPGSDAPNGDSEAANDAEVRARDGLVARLQSQLAEAGDKRRELEQRLQEAEGRLGNLHEEVDSARAVADVEVEEKGREVGELEQRLARSEQEHEAARATLSEVKGMLASLAKDLPEAGATASDASEVRRMRERLTQLDADAADRDVLLRSLTAQLQERDDRIRGLERMQGGEGPLGDADALAAKLLEMEERVGRLTEELAHERDARRRLETN